MSGQLGRGLAIEPLVAGAQLDVVEHREVERARRAPARLLDVVVLVGPGRHVIGREVRDAHRDRLDPRAQLVQLDFRCLQLIGEGGHLGHDRRHVLAPGLGLADRLGAAVAQVLQFLGAHLDALAVGLQGLDRGHVEFEAARVAQALRQFGGLLSEKGGIEHGAAL